MMIPAMMFSWIKDAPNGRLINILFLYDCLYTWSITPGLILPCMYMYTSYTPTCMCDDYVHIYGPELPGVFDQVWDLKDLHLCLCRILMSQFCYLQNHYFQIS